MNRVLLIGRLVRDPELRKTPSGSSVVSFTIAVDNQRNKSTNEKTTSFFNCVAWNATAENVARFMKKGSLVGVDGRLSQRSYTSKDGRNVSVVEIICESVQFLEKKSTDNSSSYSSYEDQGYSSDPSTSDEPSSGIDATDDQLPF